MFSKTKILALAGLLVVGALTGCTDQKQKAQKTLKEAVEECRQSDGTFHQAQLFDDSTERVLRVACDNELTDLERVDEFAFKAQTGPYTWFAGLNDATGTWVLQDVNWPTLDKAQSAMGNEEMTADSWKYAAKHLAEAQKTLPESSWIRLRRLESLLELRAEERDPRTDGAISIGDAAESQFKETIAWAEENDATDAKVEAQHLVVSHLKDYQRKLERLANPSSSSDEYVEKAIETAKKEGDDEAAEEYRKELEETREKRQKNKKMAEAQLPDLRDALCNRLTDMSPTGVKDSNLKQQVIASKKSVDCMKRAED